MLDARKNAKAAKNAKGVSSSQTAILQAIASLKTELLAKMDEKADTQKNKIRKQINILRGEIKIMRIMLTPGRAHC